MSRTFRVKGLRRLLKESPYFSERVTFRSKGDVSSQGFPHAAIEDDAAMRRRSKFTPAKYREVTQRAENLVNREFR